MPSDTPDADGSDDRSPDADISDTDIPDADISAANIPDAAPDADIPDDEREALLTIGHGAVVASGGQSLQRALTTATEYALAQASARSPTASTRSRGASRNSCFAS